MASEYLQEFEKLNMTTESIHDLEGHKVLIILKNGENLTSWNDVSDRKDIIYVSEDLSDYKNLSQKYEGLESLKAIVAFGISPEVKSMREMFGKCNSLADISALKDWNVSNVSDMSLMFWECHKLEDLSPLINWDVSAVKEMKAMFKSCYCLSCLKGLEGWDVSGLWNMSKMFEGCVLKDISALKGWDVSNVRDMYNLFGMDIISLLFGGGGNSITDLSALKDWDVSSVSDMSFMFCGAYQLKDLTPLVNWDTSGVEEMLFMFSKCSELSCLDGLERWNVSNVGDMTNMFADCSELVDISALSNWKVSGNALIRNMFKNCTCLEDASFLNAWEGHSATVKYMFDGCSLMRQYPSWVRLETNRKRRFHPLFGDRRRQGLFQKTEKRANSFGKLNELIHSGLKLISLDYDVEMDFAERSQYKNGIKIDVDDVIIDGRGHVINACEMGRIFEVSARNVTIKNVILGSGSAGEGGAILNRGELILDNVCFIKNNADEGGAIYNCATLEIINSTFKKNASNGKGGAIANVKGNVNMLETRIIKNSAKYSTIYSDEGILAVSRCDVTENDAENGSSIMNRAGNVVFSDCKINFNSSLNGILHNDGTMKIQNSLLSDNCSDRLIFNDECGNLEIIQSELSENDVKQAAICNGGKWCSIDKVLFSNNISHEDVMNIINDAEMMLSYSEIRDSGKTILNSGYMIVKMRPEDVSQKILNEGRCQMQ